MIRNTILKTAGVAYGLFHNDYTRLFIATDQAGWVLDCEARQLMRIASRSDVVIGNHRLVNVVRNQSVFYTDQFSFFGDEAVFNRNNRLAVAYFHGRRFDLDPVFERVFNSLKNLHEKIDRIQVSNSVFRDFLFTSGIDGRKLFVIPIGIDLSIFTPLTADSRHRSRERYGIPQAATVIGLFQKDGQGWDDGMQPKLIKGPDVFLQTLEILQEQVKDLFVVLSGPARGYMKAGLEKLGIPYVHHLLSSYTDIVSLYHSLDLYIIPAREEGGPKALLEAMATGVPVVTTRVGQAVDLVVNDHNGLMVDIEDCTALAEGAERLLADSALRGEVIKNGLLTARENSYDAQAEQWAEFFHGFVNS